MAGYQGYSLESDGSSLKQVDTTSGNRKSNKNNYNGSGRKFGSQNKSGANNGNSSNENFAKKVADVTKDFIFGKGGEEKEEKKKKEEEERKKIKEEKQQNEIEKPKKLGENKEEVTDEEKRRQEIQAVENKEEKETKKKKLENEKVYSSQDEWLLSFLAGAGKNKVSIRKISDEERKIIIGEMEKYWKNNTGKELSLEFLVNGAVVNCVCGTVLSRINGIDHGVYTDSSENLTLLNDTDTTLSYNLGICAKTGKPCELIGLQWENKSSVEVGKREDGNASYALTMNSYMICNVSEVPLANDSNAAKYIDSEKRKMPKIIRPVTSGQEFTISSKLFIYPKFIKEDDHSYFDIDYWDKYKFIDVKSDNIDIIVIKKLAIRSSMNKYENLWLRYIGRYLVGCRDTDTFIKIMNAFYEIPKQGVIPIEKECNLSERFTDVFKEMKRCFDIIVKNYGNKEILEELGLWKKDILAISGRNYMTVLRISQEQMMTITDKRSDTNPINRAVEVPVNATGIEEYYDNGLVLRYSTTTLKSTILKSFAQDILLESGQVAPQGTSIVPRNIYISDLGVDQRSLIDSLWDYFGTVGDDVFFITMFAVNMAATIVLIVLPLAEEVSATISIIWTVVSNVYPEVKAQGEKEKYEQYKYTQSRPYLLDAINYLNLNVMYSHIADDYTSFSYMMFLNSNTESLISNFMKNIENIYIDYMDREMENEYKSLLSILKLDNGLQGDIHYKVNKLVQLLSTNYIKERDYYVNGDESKVPICGLALLKGIGKLTVQKRDGNNKEIGCYVKNKGQYIKIEETKKVKEYFN